MICQYKNDYRAILNNKTAIFQDGNLFRDVYRHFRVFHTRPPCLKNEVPPWYALLGGAVGTVSLQYKKISSATLLPERAAP